MDNLTTYRIESSLNDYGTKTMMEEIDALLSTWEAKLVPDTRLQAIVDAWKAINNLDKNHIYNAGAGKLVVAIEDALIEEMSH